MAKQSRYIILTAVLIIAFLAESAGMGYLSSKALAKRYALRPMAERTSKHKIEITEKKERLHYLNQFKKSHLPVINPSLTTLVGLLQSGRKNF